ncbi:FAD-binding protein [Lactobacillus sp. ESL0681]|uniref:FAD-dependent oxidoreductase n=1 Tax=Lactobacillus sp. ESL0681 TaxID=2983211 RepID=UPI0023F64B12|nr:FAD-binding protein [Lactobacillus sp. ESL0681]WEV39558.1 FAD-binding protein [Lactobacillus sp. ESL0681]
MTTSTEIIEKWSKKPQAIEDIKETRTADIVIVGAGLGGMVAAAKASELGSTIVIDKMPHIAAVRQAEWAFDSKFQRDAGKTFTAEERETIIGDLMRDDHWSMANQAVVTSFVDQSGPLIDWIKPIIEENSDIRLELEPGWGPYGISYGRPGYPEPDWFVPLKKYMEKNGAQIILNMRGEQLVQDGNGKVTGIIAKNEAGEYIRYNANKGVILTTGSFGKNQEMMEDFYPREERYSHDMFYPQSTGDGHIMALQAGADMESIAWGDSFLTSDVRFNNHTNSTSLADIVYWPAYACLPQLYVNHNGERFINEGGYKAGENPLFCDTANEMRIADGIFWQTPDNKAWSIFDDKTEEKLDKKAKTKENGVLHIGGVTTSWPSPGMNNRKKLERDVKDGITVKADTIEELAAKINVPVDKLKATVKRYNEMCAQGTDSDFIKEPIWLNSIDEGPFYASRITSTPCCTRGGIVIGPHGQVMDRKGRPIEGLYAGGTTAGSALGWQTTINICIVSQMFGWLGVQDAYGVLKTPIHSYEK